MKKEKYNQKLLVEGIDDQHVVWALCNKFQLAENFDVINSGSVEQALNQLKIRFKQSDLRTVGILIDADENPNKRWQQVKEILTPQGFDLPEGIPHKGLICYNESGKKAGVWIMPDNELSGKLEDFIRFLIHEDDPLLSEANNVLDHIESKGLNKYKPKDRSKAIIHSWLAWQEDPGTPMGFAITKKYLSLENEVCKSFMNWLSELFA